jgi:hypothetical protein
MPAVEKWYFRLADRKGVLEDGLSSGRSWRIVVMGPIAELFREKPFISYRIIRK